MQPLDRNPWQGLTSAQVQELDHALLLPHRRIMGRIEAWQDVHSEYAARCAALLCANDLRGALSAAEVATAAQHMQASARASEVLRAERLAAIDAAKVPDPRGELTYVPGKKRRVRVKPDQAA